MREIRNESVRERILRNPLYLSGEAFTSQQMMHTLRAGRHAIASAINQMLNNGELEVRDRKSRRGGDQYWYGRRLPDEIRFGGSSKVPVECLPRFLIHHASPWSR